VIGRTLVPGDSKPLSLSANGASAPRRTDLDTRTLLPSDLPAIPLDATTNIPPYMPLEVLASRMLIPRDLPINPIDTVRTLSPYTPLEVVAPSMAVPKDAKPPVVSETRPRYNVAYADVVDPDVLSTGEVNLLAQPAPGTREEQKWVLRGASVLLHALAFLIIILITRLVPDHQVTDAEIDQAARSLGYLYMPPDLKTGPRALPGPPAQSPKIKIDPKFLKQIAPPKQAPKPNEITPPEPSREIAKQPTPSQQTQQQPGQTPQVIPPPTPERVEPAKPLMSIPPANAPQPKTGLQLPSYSTGNSSRSNDDGLSRGPTSGSSNVRVFGGAMPGSGHGYGGGGGGQGGQAYGGVQMLTPTEGVDFSSYLDRVVASVKRNWYAIMPTSALMGEKGRVVLQFRIFRDGSVQSPEPYMVGSSGKEPLDRAASSSIHASSPFEPLPPAFSGPYIELRFMFLYNLPLSAAQQ
jgi:outer membrane biosynthesis protein TonB